MSMIMILDSVSADSEVLEETPVIPFDSFSPWGAGGMLFGAPEDDGESICLEKSWHGLHYLLNGDPWSGFGYRAFLLCGGMEQGGDMGYGPARIFDPEEVQGINKVLQPITADELWSQFDADQMAEADIYGAGWDDEEETDLREEYVEHFEMLKKFVSQAAKDGNSLRVTMT